jgi:hypothetical protein
MILKDYNMNLYRSDLITRISAELKNIKEGMQNFKEMQVVGLKENNLRLQQYNSMQASLNEMALRFENLVRKFTEKEEESLELARVSYLSSKKK